MKLAVQNHRAVTEGGRTWVPAQLSFVYSLEQIEQEIQALVFIEMIEKAPKRKKSA
jgi:hypothetical protein